MKQGNFNNNFNKTTTLMKQGNFNNFNNNFNKTSKFINVFDIITFFLIIYLSLNKRYKQFLLTFAKLPVL